MLRSLKNLTSIGMLYYDKLKNLITEIIREFNSKFKDFDILKHKLELFINLMTIDISVQNSRF